MNGTIEVVMCERDVNGEKTAKKTRLAATGEGGAKWLADRAVVVAGKHIHPAKFNDFADQFFGEGRFAPSPE